MNILGRRWHYSAYTYTISMLNNVLVKSLVFRLHGSLFEFQFGDKTLFVILGKLLNLSLSIL